MRAALSRIGGLRGPDPADPTELVLRPDGGEVQEWDDDSLFTAREVRYGSDTFLAALALREPFGDLSRSEIESIIADAGVTSRPLRNSTTGGAPLVTVAIPLELSDDISRESPIPAAA